MRQVLHPLHVATIRGHQLRFFRTPNNDGRPDLQWVAIDDLGRCLGLSRAARRIHLRVFSLLGKETVRTVATPDGRVTIAPHSMARAAVEALIDRGRAPVSTRDDYVRAAAAAMMKLSPGPWPSPEALRAWVNVAMSRWSLAAHTFSMAELFPFITSEPRQ